MSLMGHKPPVRTCAHTPEIAAAGLANYLLHQPQGAEAIRTMIVDDIHKALDEDRVRHAAELFMTFAAFPRTSSGRPRVVTACMFGSSES